MNLSFVMKDEKKMADVEGISLIIDSSGVDLVDCERTPSLMVTSWTKCNEGLSASSVETLPLPDDKKNVSESEKSVNIDYEIQKRELRRMEERRGESRERKESAEDLRETLGQRGGLEDGERTVEDGERTVEDGERTVEDGERTVEDGERTVEDGERTVEDGERTVEDGERTVEDGERTIEDEERTVEDGERTVEDGGRTVADVERNVEDGERTVEDFGKTLGQRGGLEDGEINFEDRKRTAEEQKMNFEDEKRTVKKRLGELLENGETVFDFREALRRKEGVQNGDMIAEEPQMMVTEEIKEGRIINEIPYITENCCDIRDYSKIISEVKAEDDSQCIDKIKNGCDNALNQENGNSEHHFSHKILLDHSPLLYYEQQSNIKCEKDHKYNNGINNFNNVFDDSNDHISHKNDDNTLINCKGIKELCDNKVIEYTHLENGEYTTTDDINSINTNNIDYIIQNKMVNGVKLASYICHQNHIPEYIAQNDNSKERAMDWFNFNNQGYSPKLKRDTEVIFEEKTFIEEFDNSDDSDQSQSAANSMSSGDSTSSSSTDSLTEETTQPLQEPSPGKRYNHIITLDPCRDFQEMFSDINDAEFSMNRFHQPPKPLDRSAARRLARRLFECDGFRITDVAKHLSKRNDFSQIVGEEFANYFDFSSLRLDKALRIFLSRFILTGETQERERIMHHFSRRYVTCNNGLYNSEDACHTLICALIILNTNIHNQNNSKITCHDFILNLKGFNEGSDFSVDNLTDLFLAIEAEPIRWPMDEDVSVSKQELLDYSIQVTRPLFCFDFSLLLDSNCRDFMSGYIVRKWLKEPGGRRAAFGKRGWKLFFGRLRDLTLYLYKDHDKSVAQTVKDRPKARKSFLIKKKQCNTNPSNSNGEGPKYSQQQQVDTMKERDTKASLDSEVYNFVLPPADEEIHVNHAFASRAEDYTKKKNVFRIKTKYGSEYLFQVNTEKEMNGWINTLNYVAAVLSEPEPNIGLCTMERLTITAPPRMTTLNIRDQLESHQRCLLELERVILDLKEDSVKKLDKKTKLEVDEALRFREEELQRYKTYCESLEYEFATMQSIVPVNSGTEPSSFFWQASTTPGFSINQRSFQSSVSSHNTATSQNSLSSSPLNQQTPFNNKRLRYRAFNHPHFSQTVPPAQSTMPNPTVIINNQSMEPSDSDDGAMYSAPCNSTKTFYEIV